MVKHWCLYQLSTGIKETTPKHRCSKQQSFIISHESVGSWGSSVDLGWAYSYICVSWGFGWGVGLGLSWLCSVWFLILQQARQGCSHIGDRTPRIDTGRGRKLGHFCNQFTTMFYSQVHIPAPLPSSRLKLTKLPNVPAPQFLHL